MEFSHPTNGAGNVTGETHIIQSHEQRTLIEIWNAIIDTYHKMNDFSKQSPSISSWQKPCRRFLPESSD
jgi:hypothetical protein